MAFEIFIDKANRDIDVAIGNYLFERSYTKDQNKALATANDKIYKALKDCEFFIDLIYKSENDVE